MTSTSQTYVVPPKVIGQSISIRAVAYFIDIVISVMIDIFAKLATQAIPVGQIALIRFALQSMFLVPVVLILGRWQRPAHSDIGLYFLRGFLILASTAFIVGAVKFHRLSPWHKGRRRRCGRSLGRRRIPGADCRAALP